MHSSYWLSAEQDEKEEDRALPTSEPANTRVTAHQYDDHAGTPDEVICAEVLTVQVLESPQGADFAPTSATDKPIVAYLDDLVTTTEIDAEEFQEYLASIQLVGRNAKLLRHFDLARPPHVQHLLGHDNSISDHLFCDSHTVPDSPC